MTRLRINRSLEEELARKADDFRVEPSQGLWESVASQLPAKKPFPIKQVILGSAVAAIAALSFFLPSREDLKPNLADTMQTAEVLPEANQKHTITPPAKREIAIIQAKQASPDLSEPIAESGFVATWQTQAASLPNLATQIEGPEDRLSASAPIAFKAELPAMPELRKRNWFNRDALHLTVSGSLDNSYREMTAKNDLSAEVVNRRESSDRMLTGYRVGADLRYYVTNTFSVSLGLHYGIWGENLGITHGIHTPYYDSLGRANGHNPTEMYRPGTSHRYSNQYRYLEIPIMFFTEKPIGANLSLGAGMGVSAVYNDARSCLNYDYQMSHYVKDIRSFRTWNSNLIASAQLRFQSSEKFSITGGPSLKYSFFSTFKDSYPIDQHQYAISWNLGLQWKLFQPKMPHRLQ